jgi:hypothetical protein
MTHDLLIYVCGVLFGVILGFSIWDIRSMVEKNKVKK